MTSPSTSPTSPGTSPDKKAPPPVITAMRLMFVGSAIALVSVIVSLVDRSSLRDVLSEESPGDTASEIDSAVNTALTTGTIFGLFFVVLYALLAIQVGKGKNWARIVTLVFAVIGVVIALTINVQAIPTSSKVIMVASGVVDLAIVVLLVLKPSNAFFRKKVASDLLAA